MDRASAEWLANEARQLGVEPSLEAFTLSRVDPRSCYLRVAGRRIGGVPIFDGGFTHAEGVHGRLGPVGGDGDIGLTETSPFKLAETGGEQRGPLADARRSGHKAAVLLTRGSRPGLFPINASAFSKPFGPPMLQVSSTETEWLKEQAEARAERRPDLISDAYHSVADRWPEAIDVALLARYARAVANGALELARPSV